MTSRNKLALESGLDASRAVVDYLREHPEVFEEHPEVIAELRIPHDSGEAVSLVERQVSILREENRNLKARFEDLVSIAAENQDLDRRLHELSLALIEAPGLSSIISVLKKRLKEDFGADFVEVRIFAEPACLDETLPEFLGEATPERAKFEPILAERKPVCGGLEAAQQESLFANEEIGSVVLLPLLGRRWDGILVAASANRERYRSDMGTEFLTRLADMATLVLAPWVVAAN